MNGEFFALMFRMKYIDRWGLMMSLRPENLSEHSLECAILAHALAVIGNTHFDKNYNPDRIALKAVYHDAPEIVTGDMPTPVKYYDESTKSAYKTVETNSIEHFISLLEPELRDEYRDLFQYTEDEKRIIKASDKLCAYIKCLEEVNLGNREFSSALTTIMKSVKEFGVPELDWFMENCVSSFTLSLDELQHKD